MKFETFQVDLSQQGLRMVLKDWEAAAFIYVQENKHKKAVGSQQVHAALVADGFDISRASVINFLERMVGAEVFARSEVTGKGGHRALYVAMMEPENLLDHVGREVAKRVRVYIVR